MCQAMTTMTCAIDGCGRPTVGRGLCRKHYMRWWRNGDPAHVRKKAIKTLGDLLARTVDRGGCLEWQGSIGEWGYGCVSYHGVTWLAHRLAYYLKHNKHPGEWLVCHHCDNPACVNPEHLFLGTNKDNMRDAKAKGRTVPPARPSPEQQVRGERQWKARLTDAAVVDIRARYTGAYGELRALAKEYGVSAATVGHVVRGRTWRHVV